MRGGEAPKVGAPRRRPKLSYVEGSKIVLRTTPPSIGTLVAAIFHVRGITTAACLGLTLLGAAREASARPYLDLEDESLMPPANEPPSSFLPGEKSEEAKRQEERARQARRRAVAIEDGEYDFSYGPDCYYGAPRTQSNYDCPYPLKTGDDWNPWDDLYTWGYTARATYLAPIMGGVGFAVRRYTARHIAFESSVDILYGKDALGAKRTEIPLALDFLYFFYRGGEFHGHMLAGAGMAWAWTKKDDVAETPFYYGLRLGGGVTVMGSRDAVWGVDLVGFVRERSSGAWSDFRNPTSGDEGRAVGTLLRLSATLQPTL